jgi:DNA-directed RNA polymerase specialized sigma24 family protein
VNSKEPRPEQPDDSEHRQADAARDRSAHIERLFREHNQSLVRFLNARLASEHEAREVAQEAYVRLLQLDKPGAIGFLRAFLFKTASNLAVDRLRHRRIVRDAALFLASNSARMLTGQSLIDADRELRLAH